jgi:hypothetical protein
VPTWRVTLRHGRNWTVQTEGVAAGVSDATRALLALEWLAATASDATVLHAHRLAGELVTDTLLATPADAATEAARILALRSVRRDPWEVVLELNSATAALDLGSVVDVTYAPNGQTRYGISGPKKMLVLGLEPNAAKREITLTLWG